MLKGSWLAEGERPQSSIKNKIQIPKGCLRTLLFLPFFLEREKKKVTRQKYNILIS